MRAGRVLFYVQHMLGIGHLRRAALISRSLVDRGIAVRFVTGGMPTPDVDPGTPDVVQLPPLRSVDERFSAYVDQEGRPVDLDWRVHRRDALLSAHASFKPDAVLVESYPFGRRQMRFELLPLLDACSGALVLSSVRDVVQANRPPERVRETACIVKRHFHQVLVHGDPSFIGFEESFAGAAEIADRLVYTGYVADRPPAELPAARRRGVVVSAGGGAVGGALLEAAMAARVYSRLADEPWRLLAGRNLSEAEFAALRRDAPAGVSIEWARPDFPALLAAARASISQAGYNTVMDLVAARVPAVLVPFAGDGETEQPFRAARLADRGAAQVVEESELDAQTLARAVDAAIEGRSADAARIGLDGAAATARMIAGWIEERCGP